MIVCFLNYILPVSWKDVNNKAVKFLNNSDVTFHTHAKFGHNDEIEKILIHKKFVGNTICIWQCHAFFCTFLEKKQPVHGCFFPSFLPIRRVIHIWNFPIKVLYFLKRKVAYATAGIIRKGIERTGRAHPAHIKQFNKKIVWFNSPF